MPDETHKLQKDPPEGSRKVIEHELEKQSETRREQDQPSEPPRSKEDNRGKSG